MSSSRGRARAAYGTAEISERHRHRWEVNNNYRDTLAKHGLVLSGASPDDRLVEMIELPSHPYFVGCQFHPEFRSRPLDPHPLFVTFIRAAVEHAMRGEKREVAAARGQSGTTPIGARA